jgi:hypothetical protein
MQAQKISFALMHGDLHLHLHTASNDSLTESQVAELNRAFGKRAEAPPSAAAGPVGPLQWSGSIVEDAVDYAGAEAAIAELNAQKHQGFDDWRMPTVQELTGIVDYNRHEPAIDTSRFPGTKSGAYWTSTPVAWSPASGVWVVHFGGGLSSDYPRGYRAFVRAVRASRQ